MPKTPEARYSGLFCVRPSTLRHVCTRARVFLRQEAVVLRHDGSVAPLHLARKSGPPPSPRYSHAMASVPTGDKEGDGRGSSMQQQLAFLFGGCGGDGTRAGEEEGAFVLDFSSSGAAGGSGNDDQKADGEAVDGEDDAQVGLSRSRPHAQALSLIHI